MDPWWRYVRACRDAAGVGTRAEAVRLGVHPSTWSRRCDRDGWERPYTGVAIAPWCPDRHLAALVAVAVAHHGQVDGATSRWRHGLGPRPARAGVLIAHRHAPREVRPASAASAAAAEGARPGDAERRRLRAACRRVEVRRARWLRPDDVTIVGATPALDPTAIAIDLASTHPDEVRSYLVDAVHSGATSLDQVAARLGSVGPISGRHRLVRALADLADRAPESPFHDEVLTVLQARGYRPEPRPGRIRTPRGRVVSPDIPLSTWQVAVELDGDRFHRDREARRRDRDRLSAYASTDWSPVVVDHRTWTEASSQVLADIDAAIAAQRRRGIGSTHRPPRRAD